MLRESQAMLRKGIRELEREREKMQREEKKLQIEIKQVAKKGQIGAAKIMAKDLIRTRNAISKFHQMKAQLQAVSIRIQTMSSTAAMADAMKGAAKGERGFSLDLLLADCAFSSDVSDEQTDESAADAADYDAV
jgi:charged multivesicular body protein 2A